MTELEREGWHQVITALPEGLTTVAYRSESGAWFVPDPQFNEASLVGAKITPLYTGPETVEMVDSATRRLRAAAGGLSDVLLHWRDRSQGYMNAPPFRNNPFGSAGHAFERAAGLARDLAEGKLDAIELDRLAHFGEPGECTAYDYESRRSQSAKAES